MSTGADSSDEQLSFVDIQEELQRVDGNANGAIAKVAKLAERVEELEDEVAMLKAQVDMEKVEQAGMESDPGRLNR